MKIHAATCHPDRKHHAKGMCHNCYQKEHLKNNKNNYKKRPKGYFAPIVKNWRRNNPEKEMLARARRRRKMEFNLEFSDIKIPDICPVLGIPIIKQSEKRSNNSPSLDRIDNTKGYIKGNIIVVSDRANRLKSDSTPEELRKIADFYASLQSTLTDATAR